MRIASRKFVTRLMERTGKPGHAVNLVRPKPNAAWICEDVVHYRGKLSRIAARRRRNATLRDRHIRMDLRWTRRRRQGRTRWSVPGGSRPVSDKEIYNSLKIVALNGGSSPRKTTRTMPRRWLAAHREPRQARRQGRARLQAFPGARSHRELADDRANYIAVPVLSDGREGAPLELRSLFEQFHKRRDE